MRVLHPDNDMIGRRGALRGLLVPILAAPLALATRTASATMPSLWKSAQVLIGNSLAPQPPSSIIECPLFFDNGHFAQGFHTLDLSLSPPRGAFSHLDDEIEPDFGGSFAPAFPVDRDDVMLLAGEGSVSGGTGFFSNVTRMIIRCVYNVVPASEPLQLIACDHCVIILIRE